jgi:glutathione S-transferase
MATYYALTCVVRLMHSDSLPMPTLTLHTFPPSQPCRAVQWFASYAEIQNIEFVTVDIFKGESQTAEFTEKNYFQGIPVLQVDDQYLSESVAILTYLAKVSNSSLLPEDPLALARLQEQLLRHDNLARYVTNGIVHPLITVAMQKGNRADADVSIAKN